MPTPSRRSSDQTRRLGDLSPKDGPPLTTHELARMIGMSSTFVRSEIRVGELLAIKVGRGRRRVFRIPIHAALAYIAKLGLA
jgi:hypothetical protein